MKIDMEFPGVGRIQRHTTYLSPAAVAAVEATLLYLFDTNRLAFLKRIAAGEENVVDIPGAAEFNLDELCACAEYHPEYEQFERVYFLLRRDVGEIKIGTTAWLHQRIGYLQAAHGGVLELVRVVRGGKKLEQAFHAQFSDYRLRSEWFRAEPILQWIEAAAA